MISTSEQLEQVRRAALRVAARMVGSEEAQDIAQEVAARALPRLADIAAYRGPWAVRVATNLSVDLLRRQDRWSMSPLPERAVPGLESELGLDLRRAVATLPERQRQVVILRHLCDLDERTTADLLGISAGSVKRHLHRAVTTLRTSAHLATASTREERAMPTTPSHAWATEFSAAVEPEQGWPVRPWDHWYVESRAGRVARVAVVEGEPVLDAEGDEVMSGPGFDHQVVKVLPNVFDDRPELQRPEYVEVPGLLGELMAEGLEEAHRWGHVWVGVEHMALALAGRPDVAGMPPLDRLDAAVSAFYEGPYAPDRVAIVRQRREGAAFRRDPRPKTLTIPVEELLAAAQERTLTVAEIRDFLAARPSSFLRAALPAE